MKNFLAILTFCLSAFTLSAGSVDSLGNVVTIDTTITLCHGDAFEEYSEPGTYIDTLMTNGICTLRTVELKIHEKTPDTYELICVPFDDTTTELGRFTSELLDSNGCSYQETVEIDREPEERVQNIAICDSEVWTWDEWMIWESGTYVLPQYDLGPCPYNLILNVEVIPTSYEEEHRKICEGDSFVWNGFTITTPGTYTFTSVNQNGCDHIITLYLEFLTEEECAQVDILVFEDLNGNCSYDPMEPGLDKVKVKIGNHLVKTTGNDGSLSAYPSNGSYKVEALLDKNIYEFCNEQIEIEVSNSSVKQLFIPVAIIEECAALECAGTLPFLRRCFDNRYSFFTLNEGTVTAEDVLVTITLDPYFEFIESDMELVSVMNSDYTFSLGNIESRKTKKAYVLFNVSCDAELGQAHYLSTSVRYSNSCDLTNYTSELFECLENRGSYDPNDKSIYIDGVSNSSVIGEESKIEYLIRFQNTGTDTAFTVRIEDTLSKDFDLSSISPIAASHDFEWSVERDRSLLIMFNEINLVDSTQNEKASHGFVKFAIQLEEDRPQPGDLIENTAEIYFDFNDPIITNTVTSSYLCQHTSSIVHATICEGETYEGYSVSANYENHFYTVKGCDSIRTLMLEVLPASSADCLTSTADIDKDLLTIFPVPASDELSFNYTGSLKLSKYAFYDNQGLLVMKGSMTKDNRIMIDALNAGLYLLRLEAHSGKTIEKRVVVVK